ncbi:MAG: PDZ domain-containing protein [Thermoflexales bacterium]
MTKQPGPRLAIGLLAALALSACSGDLNPINRMNRASAGGAPTAPAVPLDLPVSTQNQLADFDAALRLISDRYIDPRALEGRTSALRETRAAVISGMTDEAFAASLRQVLSGLNDSGIELITAADLQTEVAPGGLGIFIGPPERGAERALALSVGPGSAAERAGLRAHDAIVRIDGQPVGLASTAELRRRLRGPIGSKVTLAVISPGKAVREVSITRAALSASPAAQAWALPGTNLAYLALSPADAGSAAEILAATLRGSGRQPPEGLILDLRTMQSPAFNTYEVAELFAHGSIGAIVERGGRQKIEITGKNVGGSQEMPLVILVGDQTRGPAESLAGLLQDLGRAKVVGARTPGRTEVLANVALPSGTMALTFPSGDVRGIHDNGWHAGGAAPGIRPTILIDKRFEDYTDDNDEMLTAAIKAFGR